MKSVFLGYFSLFCILLPSLTASTPRGLKEKCIIMDAFSTKVVQKFVLRLIGVMFGLMCLKASWRTFFMIGKVISNSRTLNQAATGLFTQVISIHTGMLGRF